MLLNNEIKITVTNNGEINTTSIGFNPKDKFLDVMTCLQLASNTIRDVLGEYIKNKGGVTDKELDDILKTITLEEIYVTKEN